MGMKSKRKGKAGERDAARAIARVLGATARRGQQYRGGEDSPDLVVDIPGVHWEVKRCERLSLWSAIEQAREDAGDQVPVVLHRANRRPWVVVMQLDDLPDLMQALGHAASSVTGPIYLASPYSHDDPAVRQQRYELACRVAAQFIRRGYYLYSPIVHSHPMVRYGCGTEWSAWRTHDLLMLRMSSELWVLRADGWAESRGVQCEIEAARAWHIPITYIDPPASVPDETQ